jgi:hypothetical protein
VFVALEALKITLKAESTDAKKQHGAIQNAIQATESSSNDNLYI